MTQIPPGPRTYWHLAGKKRMPSEYEIATSRLLYHPERGFEVQLPLADWYQRHQRQSALQCSDWEAFADPRRRIYSQYVAQQRDRESSVAGAVRAAEAAGSDAALDSAWLAVLEGVLAPLRYPCHGLQMAAAYVGHMAPASRIVIAAALQSADEMRRVQWLAYRLGMLRRTRPGFGDDARERWERDPAWQPWRRVVERLLTTYDWGEALVALTCVVKPAFDDLFGARLGAAALAGMDPATHGILASLAEDAAWHGEWSQALLDHVLADSPQVGEAIAVWKAAWEPEVAGAVAAIAEAYPCYHGGNFPASP